MSESEVYTITLILGMQVHDILRHLSSHPQS